MPEQGVRSVAEPSSRQDPGALSALLAELARAPEGAWEAELRPGAVVGRFELIRELRPFIGRDCVLHVLVEQLVLDDFELFEVRLIRQQTHLDFALISL